MSGRGHGLLSPGKGQGWWARRSMARARHPDSGGCDMRQLAHVGGTVSRGVSARLLGEVLWPALTSGHGDAPRWLPACGEKVPLGRPRRLAPGVVLQIHRSVCNSGRGGSECPRDASPARAWRAGFARGAGCPSAAPAWRREAGEWLAELMQTVCVVPSGPLSTATCRAATGPVSRPRGAWAQAGAELTAGEGSASRAGPP